MPVQEFALTIDVGSDYFSPSPAFVWYEPESLTPVNLSGYTAVAYIRADPPGSPDIVTITTTNNPVLGGIVLGAQPGTITWHFTGGATALLPIGLSDTITYLWWLIVRDPLGVQTTIFSGPVYALAQ
jgi:hypothetical protein